MLDEGERASPSATAGNCEAANDTGSEITPRTERKVRGPRVQREWTVVGEWDRRYTSEESVRAYILQECNDINARANMTRYPGMHADRVDSYGLFGLKRKWMSKDGLKETIILECPYVNRSGCACQVRIRDEAGRVLMEVSNAHTEESHAVDTAKYLKMRHKLVVVDRVKIAPTQTGLQLRRSLLDASPTKRIDESLKWSGSGCSHCRHFRRLFILASTDFLRVAGLLIAWFGRNDRRYWQNGWKGSTLTVHMRLCSS